MRKILKSVITDDLEHCIECGRQPVQIHHVYYGKNRKQADVNGLIIPLCLDHHTGAHGVHNDQRLDLKYKQIGQQAYEVNHSRDDFRRLFGRSYL